MKDLSKLQIIYNRVQFGADKQPKTLRVSKAKPEMDARYGNVREGSVLISVLKKDGSQGFTISTAELGTLIFALDAVYHELLSDQYKLTTRIGNNNE